MYEDNILFVKQLRELGIWVADAYLMRKKEAGGSPCLGYGLRDVYKKLAQFDYRRFDGGDGNSLFEIFNRHFKGEDDCYFAFDLDVNNYLVSFFRHNKQILEDYTLFGDLVMFDTTYL